MFSSNTTQVSDGGYQISRSLRFNSADSAYLNRTPASAGNRQTYTWSSWVKRSTLGARNGIFVCVNSSGTTYAGIEFNASDQLTSYDSNASSTTSVVTTQVFRDVSAWYHIVYAVDTTQATASNRVKLYVNGVQITSFSTADYPPQNSNTYINSTNSHSIGSWSPVSPSLYFNGYMTEVNFIDGQALTPSSFGETNAQTGVWQPKAYSGSYGTNGFYLNFSDNSNTTAATLGKDYSGNGNNWTPNNFSVTAGAGNDSLVDSPTSYGTDTGVGGEVRGNYCTWNAVLQTNDAANTYANGNLEVSSSGSNWANGTISTNTGSYYFELTPTAGASSSLYLGLNNTKTDVRIAAYSGGIEASPGGGSNQGSLAAWSNGDIIGVAVNGVSKTVQFYRNGSTYGTLVTYTTALDLFPFVRNGAISSSTVVINAGQRAFAYTAPSGYKALCTQNLPTPTIGATTATQAGKYFNPVLWTSTGTTQSITGVGFQPDFVWSKPRNAVVSNYVNDAVRGTSKYLITNGTNTEGTDTQFLTSFDSDGFTYGTSQFSNGNTMVSWNWKANGSGSTNTSGSITSTVSANTTSGFSVVTCTTQSSGTGTVGHGLGVAPAMIIVKQRANTSDWNVYHTSIGAGGAVRLNTTAATITSSAFWNDTAPTSTLFTFGAGYAGSVTVVAYCFAEVAGYSKFGSYTGNGSTDGPFVYTGFRPAYVLIKNTTSGAGPSWQVRDSARIGYNSANYILYPNLSNAEYSSAGNFEIDFLSNGFKIRTATDAGCNGSGDTMIYAAFATAPFKFSLAR